MILLKKKLKNTLLSYEPNGIMMSFHDWYKDIIKLLYSLFFSTT